MKRCAHCGKEFDEKESPESGPFCRGCNQRMADNVARAWNETMREDPSKRPK